MYNPRARCKFMLESANGTTLSCHRSLLRFLLLCFLLMCNTLSSAQENDGRPIHPSKKRFYAPEIWKESELVLPQATSNESFSVVAVSDMDDSLFKVDLSSLRIGNDGVVRLAFAVISSKGQPNILYEGYRCDNAEYKSYAMRIGYHSEWTEFRNPKWRPVHRQRRNNYRADLVEHYICPAVHSSAKEGEILTAFKKGRIRKNDRRVYR
jgi:hypothetical protein